IRSLRITLVMSLSSAVCSMPNGPATAAPIGISMAITDCPSEGSTIQLNPVSETARSRGAFGFWARSIARRTSTSTSRTLCSVQSAGPADGASSFSVTAKWRPCRTTSTSNVMMQRKLYFAAIANSPDHQIIKSDNDAPWHRRIVELLLERARVHYRCLAREVLTDVGSGASVPGGHRGQPRRTDRDRAGCGVERHRDGPGQITTCDRPLDRQRVGGAGHADRHNLGPPCVPEREVPRHERHDADDLGQAGTVPLERPLRPRHQRGVARELREADQIAGGHRRGRGLGAVVVLLEPQEHRRIVAGRAEPAAVARVEEQRGLNFSQLDCPIEPGRIAGGLEQLNQSPRETRIVFAESVNCRLAITIPANETTLARVPEMRAGEFRGANRGRTPFGSPR